MTLTPELRALQDVCARIEAAGIACMLTGSLAMAYYARPRMTRDIDLVIELAVGAVGVLAKALGEDYHLDEEAMRDALRDWRPFNAIHLPTVVKIDLIPRKPGEYRRTEFKRRQ